MMTRHDRMVAEVKQLAIDRISSSDKTISHATFSLAIRMLETIHAWENRGSDMVVQKLREVLAPAFGEYAWTTFDCNPEFVVFKTSLKCALIEDNVDSGNRKIVINNCNGGFSISNAGREWLIGHGMDESSLDFGYSRRDNELLVQMVEELGSSANGRYADLKIVEIPKDVEWEIHECDGREWVAEKHREWFAD